MSGGASPISQSNITVQVRYGNGAAHSNNDSNNNDDDVEDEATSSDTQDNQENVLANANM